MIRVRFHGRGGQGIKTASRILGTSAFLGGFQAQDSPLYGAERRGAALAAYTRIDTRPIRERGVIVDPDLIVIADETLLAEAGVLCGREFAAGVFVNTPREAAAVAGPCRLTCPVACLDLTALALAALGRASALSAAVGAAAVALTGWLDEQVLVQAVRAELAELDLAAPVIDANVDLARRVFGSVSPVPVPERPASVEEASLHVPAYAGSPRGVPIIYAAGNSPARHTGSWRVFRPAIERAVCSRCGICVWRCPDGAIFFDEQGYPVIDYDNCKGCMICAEECPLRCIREEKEVRSW